MSRNFWPIFQMGKKEKWMGKGVHRREGCICIRLDEDDFAGVSSGSVGGFAFNPSFPFETSYILEKEYIKNLCRPFPIRTNILSSSGSLLTTLDARLFLCHTFLPFIIIIISSTSFSIIIVYRHFPSLAIEQ